MPGLKNLIKRYSGVIISRYLPKVRHLFLKRTHVLQAQTPTDKSYGKNSKARQVFTCFEEYKGNQVWEGCKEQCTFRFTENREQIVCLNSPVLASRLCQLMYCRLLWAEQNVDFKGHMLSVYGLLLLYKHLFIPTQKNDFGNNYSQGLCLYWWIDKWFFSIALTAIVCCEH